MNKLEINELIRDTLPDSLSSSTEKTYRSLLVNHCIKHGDVNDPIAFYLGPDFVASLDGRPPNTRATVLAAAYALTRDPSILEHMHSVSKQIKEDYKEQVMTEERKAVLLSKEEIADIYRTHEERYLSDPSDRNFTDMLITGLMSGVFPELPPRRLMEYTELKTHPPPPRAQGVVPQFNYVINGPRGKMLMVIYHHKTSRGGTRPHLLPVPPELAGYFRKASRDGRDFLLLNEKGEKFTKASLHNRLLNIYGFGVDMLRCIFLSEMHKATPSIRKMESVAKLMGNSVGAQMSCYVKKP